MPLFSHPHPESGPSAGRPPLDLQQSADIATATFALG
jgi:hypothetical protein